jgi:hypothetical protein
MRSPRSTARLLAALMSTTALGVAGVVAAPAAHADPAGLVGFYAGSDLSSSGTDCAVTTGGSQDDDVIATSQGGPKSLAVSATGEGTNTGNAADDTDLAGSASGTLRMTERAGSFTGLTMSGSLTASVAPDLGDASVCESNTGSELGIEGYLRLAEPAWLTITVRTSARAQFQFQAQSLTSGSTVVVQMAAKRLEHTQTVHLPAGMLGAGGGFEVDASTPGATSRSTTASLTITAAEAGTARTAATGAGARVVTLPAARSCDTASLTPTFTARAGSAKSVAFQVNGRTVKTLKRPSGGGAVLLTGLPVGAATVTAVVTPSKGKRKTTVSRSYHGCA